MPATSTAPRPNIGPYRDEQAALQVIVDRLVSSLDPRAVYLFGSRAEGRARPDSDFDLLVVLDDAAPDEAVTHEAVYAPICGSGVGCDVIACRASELAEVLEDPANPWRRSWQNARLLHGRR